MAVDTVIFDFGGVLLDWNPRYLYRKIFDDEQEMEYFLENVCSFAEFNDRADAGEDLSVISADAIAKYPQYKSQIEAFYDRWDEMLKGPIAPTVQIVRELLDKGVPLYGLTNWPDDKKHLFTDRLSLLNEFNDIVVSGVEKLLKPHPDIYKALIDRNNLDPQRCIFVDDRLVNVKSGEDLGIVGHHFTGAEKLRTDLHARSLL